MKTTLLFAFALVAACATIEHSPVQSHVACGATTCGDAQYCAEVCTCCGFPPDGGGQMPSSYSECRPLPLACSLEADDTALAICLHHATGGDALVNERLRVRFPCA